MTDYEKFKRLLNDIGVEYTTDEVTIYIDQFNADGNDDRYITFYDDGKIKDFM